MWDSFPTTYNAIVANIDAGTNTIGGAFYFDYGTLGTVSSISNTFKYCYTATDGAIFYIPIGVSLADTTSTFK